MNSIRTLGLSLLVSILCIGASSGLHAQTTYDLQFDEVPLEVVLDSITAQGGLRFVYGSALIDVKQGVTCHIQSEDIHAVLDRLLTPRNIAFDVDPGKIYLRPIHPEKGAIRFKILDGYDKVPLEAAAVGIMELGRGALTDQNGEAYLEGIPPGEYEVIIRYLGYEDYLLTVTVLAGETAEISHEMKGGDLYDPSPVPVWHDDVIQAVGPSSADLSWEFMQNTQSVNEDPLESVRLLPGVAGSNSMFFNSGLHIRGGAPSENLTLLDNIRLPYPQFITGKSIINPDLVENLEVLPGGFPVRYGNHMSSVLHYQSRDGNDHTWLAKARQSLWNSQLNLEGPIKRDKVTLRAIARRNTFDWLWPNRETALPVTFDGTLKLAAQLNRKHKLTSTSLYATNEIASDPNDPRRGLQASERVLTQALQWQAIPKYSLYNKVNVLFNRADINMGFPGGNFVDYVQDDITVREDMMWLHGSANEFRAGIAAEYQRISGAESNYYHAFDHAVSDSSQLFFDRPLDAEQTRFSTYLMEQVYVDYWLYFRVGGRMDYNTGFGQLALSPRASVDLQPDERLKVNLSSGFYYQDPSAFLMTQFPDLQASRNFQNSVGVTYEPTHRLTLGLEGYLKRYDNLVIFDSLQRYSNLGEGNVQGIEFKFDWSHPRLELMGNYSLSKAERRRNLQDAVYAYTFDQRHRFNANFIYKTNGSKVWLPRRIQVDWRYASGRPFTPPAGIGGITGQQFIQWGRINASRLGSSHSLNLRFQWQTTLNGNWRYGLEWYLSLWNLYGNPNPIRNNFWLDQSAPDVIQADLVESLPIFFDLGIAFRF